MSCVVALMRQLPYGRWANDPSYDYRYDRHSRHLHLLGMAARCSDELAFQLHVGENTPMS